MKKALILAAGMGSRLAPITNEIPKSLVSINGVPILFKQLENLHKNGITDITVISGYKHNVLEERVHSVYPNVNIIEVAEYAATNNMYSAYMGRKSIDGDAFLMMNADVFYDSSVIEALVKYDSPNAIVVDIGRYMEESMKVIEKDGRLIEISKVISPSDALGCSIDVYKFSADVGQAFFDKCQEYIEQKKEVKLWSEVALNDILKFTDFRACPLVGKWFEIDNHEDLRAAEILFSD